MKKYVKIKESGEGEHIVKILQPEIENLLKNFLKDKNNLEKYLKLCRETLKHKKIDYDDIEFYKITFNELLPFAHFIVSKNENEEATIVINLLDYKVDKIL